MIGIIDAKSGNIGSIENALEHLKIKYLTIKEKRQISHDMKLILPGVGSFHGLMNKLQQLDLIDSIQTLISNGNPFLGICVGMQILLTEGLEEKRTLGLNIFKGKVIKFKKNKNTKIPLISWLKIEKEKNKENDIILSNCGDNNFYFLHSYFCDLEDKQKIIAFSKHNKIKYPAIINEKNVYGVQFHPERSRKSGLELLKNFSKI
jgi:glutamine amidotransferase